VQSNRTWVDFLPGVAIVALIVGIAGVLGPAMQSSGSGDPSVRAGRELEAIACAFSEYREQIGAWPTTGRSDQCAPAVFSAYLSGFSCLVERPETGRRWGGPYLDMQAAVDPWGRGYQIHRYPAHSTLGGSHGTIVAVSLGPNGLLDTPDAGLAVGKPSNDDLVVIINR
jgi:hypothetical protein